MESICRAPGSPSGGFWLIVGAGTGLDLLYFHNEVKITAIGLTPSLVNRLKDRAAGLDIDVTAEVMDGLNLYYAERMFDKILFNLIVAIIPDPVFYPSEAARVLKDGGRIVIFDKFQHDEKIPSLFRRFLIFSPGYFFQKSTDKSDYFYQDQG